MKFIVLALFLLIISIPAILPFFHTGFFPTHDGEWAVVRLTDMFREIKDLQIPPRFSGNLNVGYGYPLFNFTYPFPYFLGLFIHLFKIGFVDSIKIMFALSVPLSAFFMYLASKALWKNTWAGIISAILYIYFPYRMVDLYVRGSLGESLSFAIFPLLFFLILKVLDGKKTIYMISAGLSYGILILTHNIMVLYFSIFLALFLLGRFLFVTRKNLLPIFLPLVLGLGVSAFFWLPALLERKYILLSKIPIADRNLYFVPLEKLFYSPFGYGTPTDLNAFSYQLGLPHILLFFLSLFYLIFFILKKREKQSFNIHISIFIGIICIFVFLLFKESSLLWNLPLLSEINYPWTLLGLLGFLTSLLAGYLATQKYIRYISLVLSLVAIFLYLPYAKPMQYVDRGDNFYLTNDATTTSSNELMPLWVKKHPQKRAEQKVEIIRGKGKVNNISSNSKSTSFNAVLAGESTIRINTIYYPGWKVYVDNNNVPISYENEQGIMQINITQGNHVVKAAFSETRTRLISDIVSLSSFLIVLVLFARGIKYAIY